LFIDIDCDRKLDWCIDQSQIPEITQFFDIGPVKLVDNRGNRPIICSRILYSEDTGILLHEGCVAMATTIDINLIQNPISIYPLSFLGKPDDISISRRRMSDLIRNNNSVSVDIDASGTRKHDMYMGQRTVIELPIS
jgi:hypothetical protein